MLAATAMERSAGMDQRDATAPRRTADLVGTQGPVLTDRADNYWAGPHPRHDELCIYVREDPRVTRALHGHHRHAVPGCPR
ncbi:hypothetical protein QJS66_11065 [Kocuria rhizophila]|nr:hypothetical protein QJS66_11065 [Kocuria rhizophila]